MQPDSKHLQNSRNNARSCEKPIESGGSEDAGEGDTGDDEDDEQGDTRDDDDDADGNHDHGDDDDNAANAHTKDNHQTDFLFVLSWESCE